MSRSSLAQSSTTTMAVTIIVVTVGVVAAAATATVCYVRKAGDGCGGCRDAETQIRERDNSAHFKSAEASMDTLRFVPSWRSLRAQFTSWRSNRKNNNMVNTNNDSNNNENQVGKEIIKTQELPPSSDQPSSSPTQEGESTTTTTAADGNKNEDKSKPLSLADVVITETTSSNANNDNYNNSEDVDASTTYFSADLSLDDMISQLPAPTACSSSLPQTAMKAYTLDGILTDLFVQVFADRVVVGVSQLQGGKFGNVLSCQAMPDQVNPKHVEYEVTTLLGSRRDDTLLTVYARQIAQGMQTLQPNPTNMTILVAISLDPQKAPEQAVFDTIIQLVLQLYQEATSR